MPARNKKNFRSTKSGAGMTKAGVKAYRRLNPGSKLKTAVTGKVKRGSKAAKRRKSFCARSAGQMKKFPKAAKNPNSRLRQARRRWKCQLMNNIIYRLMINRPLKHKEPHTYKDICKKKYSTVPNHDGSVPGEKQSIFIDTHSDKTFKNTKAEY